MSDPRPGERIADLFCGLGNFSLPIARLGAEVVGVEGSEALVERAHANAARNGLAARCEFHAANLFETTEDSLAALGRLDKLLIDPPREGAIAVVKAIDPSRGPSRIVYVSCNPATLARDAAVLAATARELERQMRSIPGLAGATVLANGEIALILNPVALAARVAERGNAPVAAVVAPAGS